jgi:hypothetical protein
VDISEDMPSRLVMTLRSRNYLWTRYVLDKTSGRARLERRWLIFPRRAVEIALGDIVAADPIVFGTESATNYYVLLKLTSGKRYWCAGESQETSIAAAARIRAFLGLAEPGPEANPVPRSTRLFAKAVTVLGTIAVVVTLAAQASRFFVLPACDSQAVLGPATDILKRNLGNESSVSLGDPRRVATLDHEIRCQAVLTIPGETQTVGYKVFWEGWTAKIQLTGVVGSYKLDPARLAAIDAAGQDFMRRAQGSHRTGNPPRQADAAVKPLLDTLFTTSDLVGKALAASEIKGAIRWFNAGDMAGSTYVLAGTGVDDTDKLPADEATQKQTRDNVVRFSDEFGRYLDFQIRVLAAIADASLSLMSNATPEEWDKSEVKPKLDELRAAMAQTMGSDLIATTYDGLTDQWRMDRVAVVAAAVPTATRFLTTEQARGLSEQALQVVAYLTNPQVQDEVRGIAAAVIKQ